MKQSSILLVRLPRHAIHVGQQCEDRQRHTRISQCVHRATMSQQAEQQCLAIVYPRGTISTVIDIGIRKSNSNFGLHSPRVPSLDPHFRLPHYTHGEPHCQIETPTAPTPFGSYGSQ